MTRTWTRARCTTPEHALRARSLRHTLMLGHMHLLAQVLSPVMSSMYMCVSPWVHLSHSPTSICPSPSSSSSSLSCTSSSTLSSTTWSPCKTCASPRTRGVTTPTTSTPPSHLSSENESKAVTTATSSTHTGLNITTGIGIFYFRHQVVQCSNISRTPFHVQVSAQSCSRSMRTERKT